MTRLADMDTRQLQALEAELAVEYRRRQDEPLALDLTRGKPSPAQLDLSAGLETSLDGNYLAADGTDARNYGCQRGLPEARQLGAELLGVDPAQVICWGNSSLVLMHLAVDTALRFGLWGDERRWDGARPPKLLAPVPGYDRHFTLSTALGIELVPVPMGPDGPDLDEAEALARADADIKGIWCVPKYSNPTGCVYGDQVVARMAQLPRIAAADDFLILWDNAYAVHDFDFPATPLAPIMDLAERAGTAEHVVLFASTSKITYASGGLGFVAAADRVLDALEARLNIQSIGPDKVNQLRHARFLGGRLEAHMARHAELMKPKFAAVERALQEGLGSLDVARWTTPGGGYFVSLDTRPGLAGEVAGLAAAAGLNLTPPGATYPGGNDPNDTNLRIAPSFAQLEDIEVAMDILVLCVKLVSTRNEIAKRDPITNRKESPSS